MFPFFGYIAFSQPKWPGAAPQLITAAPFNLTRSHLFPRVWAQPIVDTAIEQQGGENPTYMPQRMGFRSHKKPPGIGPRDWTSETTSPVRAMRASGTFLRSAGLRTDPLLSQPIAIAARSHGADALPMPGDNLSIAMDIVARGANKLDAERVPPTMLNDLARQQSHLEAGNRVQVAARRDAARGAAVEQALMQMRRLEY
jgi:hypothetical protein